MNTRGGKISATLLTALVVALGLAAGASPAPTRPSGTLELDVVFSQFWRVNDEYCPPGTPAVADCLRSIGRRAVAGLGRVTVSYDKLLPNEDPDCFMVQNNRAVLEVAGKGSLELSRPGRVCAAGPPPREDGPFRFSIADGSGRYAGATGSLVYRGIIPAGDGACRCGTARDTWTGTLTVPGLEFDLTPPVLTGAVSKTVRAPKGAKRVRVRYTVTAKDEVDGSVPVACKPRSGSQFRVGRTRVTCSATDSSANTRAARFTITVRPR